MPRFFTAADRLTPSAAVRVLALLLWALGLAAPATAQTIREVTLGNAVEAIVIAIDGPIEADTARRFRALIGEGPREGFRVLLNSRGGNLQAGLELGQIFRDRGYQTEVGRLQPCEDCGLSGVEVSRNAICASSCAFAFMGGERRLLQGDRQLGLHQFSARQSPAAALLDPEGGLTEGYNVSQLTTAILVNYLVEMGIDARIFRLVAGTSPKDLHWVSQDEAKAFDVVTPVGFGPWRLEPWNDGVIAVSERLTETRAYDHVFQATAFCRASGEKVLLLTLDLALGSTSAEPTPVFWRFGATGEPFRTAAMVPGSGARMRATADRTYVEIPVDPVIEARLLAAKGFVATVDEGRAGGGPYRFWLEDVDYNPEMLRAAFRHCI